MSRRTRVVLVTALSLGICTMLACSGGISVGNGLIVAQFTVGGKTFTFTFGDVGRIQVQSGVKTTVPTTRGSVFTRLPTDTPPSGTVRLPANSVGTFGRAVGKLGVRSQVLPLNGSATIRILVAQGSSTDPCADGALLAEYDITYTTGVTAVLEEVFDLSAQALAIILTNDVTFCIEVTADFDAEFTIGDLTISFGGGGEADSADFTLANTDFFENIHILLPGDDFDASNRLTPGSQRSVTRNDLATGEGITVRAGRNGTVLDTTQCPAVTGANYQADVTWDGGTVTCNATQDDAGTDGATVTPGTIIQVPIANSSSVAIATPLTDVYGGVDYAVVGVLDAGTPDSPVGTTSDAMSVDLSALGFETVDTLYLATHNAWVPDVPGGVTMATLTVSYVEGGTPTSLDLVLGGNTAEWSFDRLEHVTDFGGVQHAMPTPLYSFETSLGSTSVYTGYVYSVTLPLDSTRTLACLTLTMADVGGYVGLRPSNAPVPTWAGQAMTAITLEGPAGTPALIGNCSGDVIPGGDVGTDGNIFCDEQADCAADEICTPDGVCIPGDFDTDGLDCSLDGLCSPDCGDTDPDCDLCGDDGVCMEGCPGIDPDCTCDNCPGECVDGICFAQGDISYADVVLSYDPEAEGGPRPGDASADPTMALGAPNFVSNFDGSFVSLSRGGVLEVGFTDNVLTNSGDTQTDLRIFEVGSAVEATFVAVRATSGTRALLAAQGIVPSGDWFDIGRIEGSTRNIDIDQFFPGFDPGELEFDAVQLIDDPNEGPHSGTTPGADIDAVGAIATLPVSGS